MMTFFLDGSLLGGHGVVFSGSCGFGLGVGFFSIKMVMSRVTVGSCFLGRGGDGLTGTGASCLWCAMHGMCYLVGNHKVLVSLALRSSFSLFQ